MLVHKRFRPCGLKQNGVVLFDFRGCNNKCNGSVLKYRAINANNADYRRKNSVSCFVMA